jgi:hypothetical protein
MLVVDSADNQLTFTARQEVFSRRIVIEFQNPVKVTTLLLSAVFVNVPEAAEQVVLNCVAEMPNVSVYPSCTEGATLPGLGELTVHLTATLPVSGTYSGRVSLVFGGTRQALPLTVHRTALALPVSVHAVEIAQATGSPLRNGETTVGWWLTLQETGLGQAIMLNQPAFLTLSRLDSNQ